MNDNKTQRERTINLSGEIAQLEASFDELRRTSVPIKAHRALLEQLKAAEQQTRDLEQVRSQFSWH